MKLNSAMPSLLLAHGWGYSRHVFEPLLRALQQHSPTPLPRILVLDQGYFEPNGPQLWEWQPGQFGTSLHSQHICWVPSEVIPNTMPNTTANNPTGSHIGIGHSQGLAHSLELTQVSWHGLISLQGFACFTRSSHNPQGVPARVLHHMQAMLQSKPCQVLADFYARCGDTHTLQHHPERTHSLPAKCIQALHEGLSKLHQQDLRPALSKLNSQGVPLAAVLAQNDALLHPDHAQHWPAHVPVHSTPGGHVPWLTHPNTMAQCLFNLLEKKALGL